MKKTKHLLHIRTREKEKKRERLDNEYGES